jgi:hypothetical protein
LVQQQKSDCKTETSTLTDLINKNKKANGDTTKTVVQQQRKKQKHSTIQTKAKEEVKTKAANY